MTDNEILNRVKQYFVIQELVGVNTYNRYGKNAWKFIDIRLLHALLIIRQGIGKPITVNNWFFGGKFTQRGLRTNLQQIFKNYFKRGVLYLSAHVMGKAIDFDVEGMTANEVRIWLIQNEDLFPFKIRLEQRLKGRYINWVHLDVFQDETKPKIYLFDV